MQNDLSNFLIKEPETFFNIPTLTYKSSEIQDAIERFNQPSESKFVYSAVVNLLMATKKFRNATVPDGIFAQARNLQNLDQPLNDILQEMDRQFATAEGILPTLSEEDKKILKQAIRYCLRSVREQMLAIPFGDNLFLLWLKSPLRRRIEKKS